MHSKPATTLDLRELGCGQRHGLVLQCLAAIDSGQSITIINDHEPEGLKRQIASEFRYFDWESEKRSENEFHVTIRLTQ